MFNAKKSRDHDENLEKLSIVNIGEVDASN